MLANLMREYCSFDSSIVPMRGASASCTLTLRACGTAVPRKLRLFPRRPTETSLADNRGMPQLLPSAAQGGSEFYRNRIAPQRSAVRQWTRKESTRQPVCCAEASFEAMSGRARSLGLLMPALRCVHHLWSSPLPPGKLAIPQRDNAINSGRAATRANAEKASAEQNGGGLPVADAASIRASEG